MNSSTSRTTQEQVSWVKVLVWTSLFFFAWNWQSIPQLLTNGELVGPDDYLRLHQVQNWMGGQGWYDLTVQRMNPPIGGDIHWSRLVDVPIAAIIWAFSWFADPNLAWRLAAIVWPLVLFLCTVAVIVTICDRLVTNYNRLLAVLFSVLCVSSIQEFVPGRFDHHNLQILLINLVLLGLVSKPGLTSDLLIGAVIPLSLSIGLDSAMLFVPALTYLGIEWAMARPGTAGRLFRIGVMINISAVLLYATAFSPSGWNNARCDAYSMFYLIALLLVSIGFVMLPLLRILNMVWKRVAAGAIFSLIAVGGLLLVFPECSGGPLSALGDEADQRWLATVQEAKGIVELLALTPEKWLSVVGYLAVMLIVSAYVTWRQISFRPQLGILFFILVVCVMGMFFQFRVLRTGIYVVIPFCVVFAAMTWNHLSSGLGSSSVTAIGLQAVTCIMMISAAWSFAGTYMLSPGNASVASGAEISSHQIEGGQAAANKLRRPNLCFSEQDMAGLGSLPSGLVIADLNSAAAVLVHTNHSVLAGPYHRNENAILAVLNFFETNEEAARKVADASGASYVAYCAASKRVKQPQGSDRLDARILEGDFPAWLEPVSRVPERLLVFRLVR